jgi:hypothetical protein
VPGSGRTSALTLEEAGRLAGHHRWVEMRLFETLGGWVQAVSELDAKLRIGADAPHHAWHAELWRERLPELAGVNRDELTVPFSAATAALMDAVGEPSGPGQTIEKLVGVYRLVVPRMVAAYTRHLRRASTVSDGPTIRCLQLILHDELEDWREGELLVQSLLTDEAAVRRAAAQQARLEGLLVRAGGIVGPVEPIGPGGTATGA